jgi:hypothetical protein
LNYFYIFVSFRPHGKWFYLPAIPGRDIPVMRLENYFKCIIKKQKRLFIVPVLLFYAGFVTSVRSQDEPLADYVRNEIQHESFRINVFIRTGFRYSYYDDNFQNGRRFEVADGVLNVAGILDGKIFYRLLFNMAREPNLLESFAGYRHSNSLRLTLGAQKPRQTLDYIPSPAAMDFIYRTQVTGLLVQTREIGFSADGDINDFYYFAGIFNGTRLVNNNNNKFYFIGRLQYSLTGLLPGTVRAGVSGSAGDSEGTRSGAFGPELRGERAIYGADIRVETGRILIAAEYLEGRLETVDIPDEKETISGHYLTAGYKLFKDSIFLARLQSLQHRVQDQSSRQLTLGINHHFSSTVNFQFNLDSFYPENGKNNHGAALMLRVLL